MIETNIIHNEDSLEGLKKLPDNCIDCCVTSPPYFGLRDYNVEGQMGNEETPDEYIRKMVELFHEVKRILKDEGTLWLNIGDSYAGHNSRASNNGRAGFGNPREKVVKRIFDGIKQKDLIGIPWLLAFGLREDGWYLRQDIIWEKGNPIPESVTDRCTKSHEYIFLLSKSPKYYFDHLAIKEPAVSAGQSRGDGKRYNKQGKSLAKTYDTRNKRDVWTVNVKPYTGGHYASYPVELITPCILAGCPKDGIVLDPFMGSGTTGLVAKKNGRKYIGFELNPEYVKIAEKRIEDEGEFLNI